MSMTVHPLRHRRGSERAPSRSPPFDHFSLALFPDLSDSLHKEDLTLQIPGPKTPVARCVQLALYCGQMLSKFPHNPILSQLAPRMSSAGTLLDDVQASTLPLSKSSSVPVST